MQGLGGSIDRVGDSTTEMRDFVVVWKDVGVDTNKEVRKMGVQIEQPTKKLISQDSKGD